MPQAVLSQIVFRSFQPADRVAFRALNEAWIQKHFRLEEKDRETLEDPERHILAKGGYIFMAERGAQPIGTCALLALGDGRFEIAKMTVAESERGQGVGRQLLEYAIAFAREKAIPRLYLETNTKLQNAIRIYEAVGFRHLPTEQVKPSPYIRANVFMEMLLS
jgi:GNAT superfamily N-acetyltransferase